MSEQMDALVLEYNTLTGKNIKRFASLAIGQARLEKAKFEKENPKAPAPKPVTAAAPAKKKPAKNSKMSESVKDSWDDKDVATRRGKRNSCMVDGTHYRTISEAFAALKLPTGRFIPFRKKLKQEKHAEYEHNGKVHKFTITDYTPKSA